MTTQENRMPYQAFVKRFLTVVVTLLALAALWFLRHTALLAFFALVVAVGFSIPARRLRKLGLPRGLANALSVVVIGLTILVLLLWVVPTIAIGLGGLLTGLPQGFENAVGAYNDLRASNDVLGRILPPPAEPSGSDTPSEAEIRALLDRVATTGLPILVSGGSAAVSLLANLVLVLFIAVLFLTDPTTYVKASLYLTPKSQRERVLALWGELYRTLTTWLSALFISITITVSLVALVLGLLGMPHVAVIAAFAGLATFIPNIGAFLPLIPIAIFTLASEPSSFFVMAPAYLAIQMLESNVLTPLIVKRELSIPAGGTFLFQIVAGLVFGFMGILLAVPILAVTITLVRELYSYDVLGLRQERLVVTLDRDSRLRLTEGEGSPLPTPVKPAKVPRKPRA